MEKRYGWLAALLALTAIILILIGGIFIKKAVAKTYETVEIPESSGQQEQPLSQASHQTSGQWENRQGDNGSMEDGRPNGLETEGPDGDQPRSDGSETEPTEPEPFTAPVLMFAGDVLLSDHVLNAYKKTGSISGVVGDSYLEKIQGADIFMVNQEFPFSNRGQAAADKQYTFRLPPERVSLLLDMGIDMVTLANNHSLDFGRDALLDTLDTLNQAGLPYVGAGENLEEAKKLQILETKGKTIGFLGASRVIPEGSWNAGTNTPGLLTTYDSSVLVEEIRKARELCDYVVVYVHWGIERDEKPQEYQRVLGKQYIDAGADMVIGSHPHVLQGIEYYNGKPIVYSLGNFVFGSSIPRTALLKVDLLEEELKLTLIPGTSSGGYTREITDQAKMQEFYRYMEGISFGIKIEDGIVEPGL